MITLRRSVLLAATAVLLAPLARGADIIIKNDSLTDGSTVALQLGFVAGETGAAVLDAQPADYPIKLKDIRVFIEKCSGIPATTVNVQLYVWATSTISGSNPSLASAVYTSPQLSFIAGGFNVWDVSNQDITLTSAFTVGCRVINPTFGNCGGFTFGNSPNLVTDNDGCQNGKNWVRQTNGVWANLCSFGVSGDLAIRVTATNATGQFIDLGNGLAGDFAPTLSGSGSLAGGGSFTIALAGMPPSTFGPLFLGLSQLAAPFKGGVLVPMPDFTITLATSGGALSIPGGMPPGVPSNTALFLHAWFPDAGAPFGADASNALELLTP